MTFLAIGLPFCGSLAVCSFEGTAKQSHKSSGGDQTETSAASAQEQIPP